MKVKLDLTIEDLDNLEDVLLRVVNSRFRLSDSELKTLDKVIDIVDAV